MSKVFRLFSDKDLQHWENTGTDYGPKTIEKIANPDGDFASKEPTSIPSPFARIDLFRTAFQYVMDKKLLDGDTIYHRLVSDCLDIAEIFFKIDSLGGRAQIRTWSKKKDLEALLTSANPAHRLYGETLDLFFRQDQEAYNFHLCKNFFFLFIEHKIVGGTSPSTMFFTSGNDLSFTKIKFGNDTLFSGKPRPLYKRDPEFQRYLQHFFKANPAAAKMAEFSVYLKANLDIHSGSRDPILLEIYNTMKRYEGYQTKEVPNILSEFVANYDPLDTGTENEVIDVLGLPLMKKKQRERKKVIAENSQFVIKATKSPLSYPPLLLQDKFSMPLVYTDPFVRWDNMTPVPAFDAATDLNKRRLPGVIDEYPYLTISDFLEPFLVRLPYPINRSKFFDGNLGVESGDKGKSYLLPLTSLFFDFFNPEDLLSEDPGTPSITIMAYAGSVDVTLKIPIRASGQSITFKRTYNSRPVGGETQPDVMNNKGFVVDYQMGLAIFPDIRADFPVDLSYRVMLQDQDQKHIDFKLQFFTGSNNQRVEAVDSKRSDKEMDPVTTKYYALKKQFDYIQLDQNGIHGIMIPTLRKCFHGSDVYKFAIDFGTTNTHIEYKTNGARESKPFEITNEDIQVATLHDPALNGSNPLSGTLNLIKQLIPHEFLPEHIGKGYEFQFPQRTALSHHQHLRPATTTHILSDFNIPFFYEKLPKRSNSKIFTNLKWSNYTMLDEDRIRVEKFFEQIIFLIRNKVLIKGGDLENTEITWFYPSSMSSRRKGSLEKTWRSHFATYISRKEIERKLRPLSESVAPFYYFKENLGVDAAHYPVVGIDIGGGTTDVVIYRRNQPELLTSFRFAANTIFGGPFELNGLMKKYLPKISGMINENITTLTEKKQHYDANNLSMLGKILQEIGAEKKAEDISAFFFAIEHNRSITGQKIPISFNELLTNDDDFKILFIVFYAAIIYHVAKLMRSKKMDLPRHITFSGTGSKIINIADESSDLKNLQLLTRWIFEKVYGLPAGKIKLWKHAEPKEITCKGGLLNDNDVDVDDIKTILLGDTLDTMARDENLDYSQVCNNETILTSVIQEVNIFIDMLFDLDKELNLSDKFGINSSMLSKYRSVLKEDLITKLRSELDKKAAETKDNTEARIQESLFFYPIAGALVQLSHEIAITPFNN